MSVRDVHIPKHQSPKDVIPLGISIWFSELQPQKVPSPNDVNPFGRVIEYREVQSRKQ